MTPLHWKKEESRTIKLSDLERLESERKRHQERRERDRAGKQPPLSSVGARQRRSGTPELPRQGRGVDYNALDYEEHSDGDDDADFPKKQVPSLVQYPLPG